MLLSYGYLVKRHDIRSASKAVGTLYQCSSSEDLMMALSWQWMNGHHHFSRTCTRAHSCTPEAKPQKEPGTSQKVDKYPVFKLSLIAPAILFYIPHIFGCGQQQHKVWNSKKSNGQNQEHMINQHVKHLQSSLHYIWANRLLAYWEQL